MIRRRIYFSILDPAYSRPGGTWWYRDFDVTMRRELVNTMTLPMHNTTNILVWTKWLRQKFIIEPVVVAAERLTLHGGRSRRSAAGR